MQLHGKVELLIKEIQTKSKKKILKRISKTLSIRSQNNTNLHVNLKMSNNDTLILDDILQLLSITLMSIGEDKHPTAQFYKLSTLFRVVNQMKNGRLKDYESVIKIKLNFIKIKTILDNTQVKKSDAIFPLIVDKCHKCEQSLISVETSINSEILNIYNTLLPILESLLNLKKRIIDLPRISVSVYTKKSQI